MTFWIELARWFATGENWTSDGGILSRTVEHLWVSALVCVIAVGISLPVAVWLGHIGRGGALAINVSNVGRAVPTLAALVVLALTPLGQSRTAVVVLVLVLFAVPPVITNGYVGMREVDRDTVDAARGMGMTGWQIARTVELPLAAPLIMNGVRQCVVQVIATLTIAALIAGPGLGRIISSGFGRQDYVQAYGGAIAVTVLALVAEGVFARIQRAVDPLAGARRRSPAVLVPPGSHAATFSD
jgi:osmoprotectant transport system permease protein